MITRRATPPLLYAQRAPARWLRTLVSTVDEAAAELCRQLWQHGARAGQPVRLAPAPRLRAR